MAAFDSAAFSVLAFSSSAFDLDGDAGIVQPVLPILRPGFRSIDAKSIADVYNRGTPDIADYTWPNERKFYQ